MRITTELVTLRRSPNQDEPGTRDVVPGPSREVDVGGYVLIGDNLDDDPHYLEPIVPHFRRGAVETPQDLVRLTLLDVTLGVRVKLPYAQQSDFSFRVNGVEVEAAMGQTYATIEPDLVGTRGPIVVEVWDRGTSEQRGVILSIAVRPHIEKRRITNVTEVPAVNLLRQGWALKALSSRRKSMLPIVHTLDWLEWTPDAITLPNLEAYLTGPVGLPRDQIGQGLREESEKIFVWVERPGQLKEQMVKKFDIAEREWDAALRALGLAAVAVHPHRADITAENDAARAYRPVHSTAALLKICEILRRFGVIRDDERIAFLDRVDG